MFKIEHNFRSELQLLSDRWGIEMQEFMAIEEMSELTKELIKKIRGKENQQEIIKETADVLITVLQMAEINGYDEVMKIVNEKMIRGLNKFESTLDT